MTKVFEAEVGDALRQLGRIYVHKCPDHPHGIPDKVDFLGVYRGRGFGVEAKEVSNREDVATTILTPNQRACLTTIHGADGFAGVLINFDRIRGVRGRVGFCMGWRYEEITWGGRFSIHDRAATLIPRITGGWDIREWMRQA